MLPLRQISLIEYERRIKKLVSPKMKDCVTVGMLVECFKDHWAFENINEKDTLVHDMMFDQIFLYEVDDPKMEIDF